MPSRPLARLCTYRDCPNVALSGTTRCSAHPRPQKPRPASKSRGTPKQRGYGADWQRLRKQVLAQNPRCRMCGKPATVVDHVRPFRALDDPRRMDPSNQQALCRSCHGKKSRREARR